MYGDRDDAAVRRSCDCEVVHGGGEAGPYAGVVAFYRRGVAGVVRARGQEDEEREEVQGIVRQRSAEEGEDDRAHQGQGRSPQVHSLASPFQAHLILTFISLSLRATCSSSTSS